MNTSIEFVGFVDLTKEGKMFLADVRKVLVGTDFGIWFRGRNPNRKQHIGQKYGNPANTFLGKRVYTRSHAALRQTLPLHLSTYGAMYLRPKTKQLSNSYWPPEGKEAQKYLRDVAKVTGIVDAIRKIYESNNIKINTIRS